jgi:hypothetical protein
MHAVSQHQLVSSCILFISSCHCTSSSFQVSFRPDRSILTCTFVYLLLLNRYLVRCTNGELHRGVAGARGPRAGHRRERPGLTLGLSPHSDPGVLTVLLADEWATVQPVRDAFIVNVGDQIQVTNQFLYRTHSA